MTTPRAPIKIGPYNLEATDEGTLVLSLDPSIKPPPLWSEVEEEDVQRNAVDEELDELRRYRAWAQKPRSRPFEFLSPLARQIMDPDGEVLRYSEDQPRDANGRFGEGSGTSEGPSIKDRVKAEIADHGGRSEKAITRIGGMVREEIDRRMESHPHPDGPGADYDRDVRAYVMSLGKMSPEEREKAEAGEGQRLKGIYSTYLDQEREAKNQYDVITREVLAEIRPFGPSEDAHHTFTDMFSDAGGGVKALEGAMNVFPTAWLEHSANSADGGYEKGKIYVEMAGRGSYNSSEATLRLPRDADEHTLRFTAIHEMGHRFEGVVPRAKALEKAFYERRVGKEALAAGPKRIPGYGENEVGHEDHFVTPYMGKSYGGKNYELLSMGVENVLGGGHLKEEVRGDRDYHHFILGMLAAL